MVGRISAGGIVDVENKFARKVDGKRNKGCNCQCGGTKVVRWPNLLY